MRARTVIALAVAMAVLAAGPAAAAKRPQAPSKRAQTPAAKQRPSSTSPQDGLGALAGLFQGIAGQVKQAAQEQGGGAGNVEMYRDGASSMRFASGGNTETTGVDLQFKNKHGDKDGTEPEAVGKGEFCGPQDSMKMTVPDAYRYGKEVVVSFAPACKVHDHCYTGHGPTREECDKTFLSDMEDLCREGLSDRPKELQQCLGIAKTYYAGVWLFGSPFFEGIKGLEEA